MLGKGKWPVIGLQRSRRIEMRVLFSCRPLTGKRRKCQLCELCASSEAGGEKDFTAETQRTRRRRFFSLAESTISSVISVSSSEVPLSRDERARDPVK